MPGRTPKPAALRERRNRKSTAADLVAPDKPIKRSLPKIEGRRWLKQTREWWARVWASPMAGEYLETDADGLGRLAMLVDDFHAADSPHLRKELMVEIRLQEARFGLSPVDRARLHWEVAKGEEAEKRRRKPGKPKRPARAKDPRAVIRAV